MSVRLLVLTCFILHGAVADGFIRDVEIFSGVIGDVQRYFNNSNIVLFHAMDNLGIFYCIFNVMKYWRFIYELRQYIIVKNF